jgi:hypothetical protein
MSDLLGNLFVQFLKERVCLEDAEDAGLGIGPRGRRFNPHRRPLAMLAAASPAA